LDYQLIAEGVETKEQASIINDLDCQIAQGYFYSKPLPSDKIPELFDVNFFA
jgi:EAL domain-containing protein (putative c-di-GMP-specific phosphodiesterase class I)